MRINTGPVQAPCLHMSILEYASILGLCKLLVYTCQLWSAHQYWTCACSLFTHVHTGVRTITGPVHATCLHMSILEFATVLDLCMLLVYTCPFWDEHLNWTYGCSLFLHMSILECTSILHMCMLLVYTCPFRSAHQYWTYASSLFTHCNFGVRINTGPVQAPCLHMSILECASILGMCMLLVYTCPFWRAHQYWTCACSLFTHAHSGVRINTGPVQAPCLHMSILECASILGLCKLLDYTCLFWSAHQYWACASSLFTHVNSGVRINTGPVHAPSLHMSILECTSILGMWMLLVYTCPFRSAHHVQLNP